LCLPGGGRLDVVARGHADQHADAVDVRNALKEDAAPPAPLGGVCYQVFSLGLKGSVVRHP